MSIDTAIARVAELQQMLGMTGPAMPQAQTQTSSAFAAQLALAEGQTDVPSALPGTGPGSTMPLQLTGTTGPFATPGVTFPQTDSATVGARIVQLAQNELGVSESPPGSNDSARIKEYRGATAGARDTPGPWCAYFVTWLSQQAGAPIGPNGAGTGWVPALEQWGREQHKWFSGQLPEPGDIVIFERTGDGVGDHTGIVESVDADGTIHTIEGNTGDSNVARREHTLTGGDIKGFVRPG